MTEIKKLTKFDAASIEAAIRAAGCEQIGPYEDVLPRGAGWAISQSPKEAAAFLAKMHEMGVRSVLEIGTFRAGFARFMGVVMGWQVVTVDIQGPPAPPHDYEFVHLASGDYTPDRRFDLVFIDGDHSYEAVRADYERFAPYADKAVALHDVLGNHACEGVKRFFEEIRGDEWQVEVSDDWPLGIAWQAIEQPEPVATKPAAKRSKK